MDKRICAVCVVEAHLAGVISRGDVAHGLCDYCGVIARTISINDLAEYCDEVIETFYEPTAQTDAVVHFGRDPEGEQLVVVLEEMLGAIEAVATDVAQVLEEQWFDWGSGAHKYGEDPYFQRRWLHSSHYNSEWSRMERSLKAEARLCNPLVNETLEKVFGPLLHDRTPLGHGLIVKVGPGTHVETLFRSRIFQRQEDLEKALLDPADQVGPPPPGIGRAGRMNAQGISTFYGSTLSDIAIAEVRPPVGCDVLVGKFRIIRSLLLLDLDKLEEVDVPPELSLFDPATKERAERSGFLRMLSRLIVMPVMPDQESDGYLITQAIADFLATHQNLNLDGILFKSAQYQGPGASKGRNVVLFNKASRVSQTGKLAEKTIGDVQLFESDEEGEHWRPVISLLHSDDVRKPPTWAADPDVRPKSLELDLGNLEIHQVEGVFFKTSSSRVETIDLPKAPKGRNTVQHEF